MVADSRPSVILCGLPEGPWVGNARGGSIKDLSKRLGALAQDCLLIDAVDWLKKHGCGPRGSPRKLLFEQDPLQVEAVASPPWFASVDPADLLASVYYTSGSTGKPKAVATAHHG